MQIVDLISAGTAARLGVRPTNDPDGAPRRAPKLPPPPLVAKATFDDRRMTLLVETPEARVHLVRLRGRAQKHNFTEKSDLWLTAVGYPTGRIIKRAIHGMRDQRVTVVEQIRVMAQATNWTWRPRRDNNNQIEFWELRRDYPDKLRNGRKRRNRRWSVIMLVEVPDLEDVYARLEDLLGSALDAALPRPVAYITLFVKGASLDGVGLASPEEFEAAKVKRWYARKTK